MSANDTAATREVRDEHRIIVTAGTTITWLNIYEITDNQFYVVCSACNDSTDTASRSAACAWASQHARQAHANGSDNECSASRTDQKHRSGRRRPDRSSQRCRPAADDR